MDQDTREQCFKLIRTNINHTGGSGITALMLASKYGDVDMIQLLITSGANLDQIDNSCRSALIYAAANSELVAVEKLLLAGANPNIVSSYGFTALNVAANQEIKNLLVRGGAIHNIEDSGIDHKGREIRPRPF
jgi:ankyrin repeat protein